MTEDAAEARAAHNEAIFRNANERLSREREALAAPEDRTPFLCECADTRCNEIVLLTVEEYERARSQGDWFFVATHHLDRVLASSEITELGGYALVRKRGRAGEIARAEDPRSRD
jgi:hypothetical protein